MKNHNLVNLEFYLKQIRQAKLRKKIEHKIRCSKQTPDITKFNPSSAFPSFFTKRPRILGNLNTHKG